METNQNVISLNEFEKVENFFKLKAEEESARFKDFGKGFNRISITDLGDFYSVIDGKEEVIGDSFKGVILLQSIWYSYYDSSNKTYPIRTNQLKGFDGYVRLVDEEQGGIVFEGPYSKFKEYILKNYPDETYNRLHKKEGYVRSFITPTRFIYLLKDNNVFRMTISKTAYGDFKEPAEGTFLRFMKDTKFLYNKYEVEIGIQSEEVVDKKTFHRPTFTILNEITDMNELVKIAKLRMGIEESIFREQEEIRLNYEATQVEVSPEIELQKLLS